MSGGGIGAGWGWGTVPLDQAEEDSKQMFVTGVGIKDKRGSLCWGELENPDWTY